MARARSDGAYGTPHPAPVDLNRLSITSTDGPPVPFADPSASSADGLVSVYFRGIADRLVEHIAQADVVIGCVAWLMHRGILGALARTKGTALIVQKEDFLRPDLGVGDRDTFHRQLRRLYAALPEGPTRYAYEGTMVPELSFAGDPTIAPVRCVGGHNADRAPAFPRAHRKFVLFCRYEEPQVVEEQNGTVWSRSGTVQPYAAWTGSFNFTLNAASSLENAVILREPTLVNAYYEEWAQVLAVSEPLDWTADWVEPDWRIGS